MFKRTIPFTIVLSSMSIGTVYAQQCLHGPDQTPDQAARRREALTATRTINNIQANRPAAANGSYLRQAELVEAPYAVRMRESTDATVNSSSPCPVNPGDPDRPYVAIGTWSMTLP